MGQIQPVETAQACGEDVGTTCFGTEREGSEPCRNGNSGAYRRAARNLYFVSVEIEECVLAKVCSRLDRLPQDQYDDKERVFVHRKHSSRWVCCRIWGDCEELISGNEQ